MLKIIIPMAGSSEIFNSAGYYYPKPLIEIKGKLMIEHVLKNPLSIEDNKEFIFVIKEEDCVRFHLDNTLKLICPNSKIVKLKKDTKGGLCSVLMAIDFLNSEDNILILNGDQIIDYDFNAIINYWLNSDADAGLVTFNSVHPRWSYARILENKVLQTAEKNPISNNAIAGVYYFKNMQDFIDSSFSCIKNDANLDGQYFISAVINELILKNKIVIPYNIDKAKYHLFYSPQILQDYERNN
jgi:bifunctional N-acetylglucosamine-1-phosphate-uridyltransferase/glucosamine-1-phosphate-acetyltransferase GlmU-like protein